MLNECFVNILYTYTVWNGECFKACHIKAKAADIR